MKDLAKHWPTITLVDPAHSNGKLKILELIKAHINRAGQVVRQEEECSSIG
jgi:hypothetical protein